MAFRLKQWKFDDPAIAELYERSLVLVRPDGHVAWRGDRLPGDVAALTDRVRGALPVHRSESDADSWSHGENRLICSANSRSDLEERP